MYAMQYEITLPADYDMSIIRHRVATRGHRTDDFGGLGVKAYCVRERGVGGSTVNQYAPFYLWHTIEGMNRFLWGGGGFQGIVTDFGRPRVRTWTGAGYAQGPDRQLEPTIAIRHTEPLPADIDPIDAARLELSEMDKRSATSGVVVTAFGIDPMVWEIVQFTLCSNDNDLSGIRYQVLHQSIPDRDRLASGPHW
ncbi:MAG TPA: DUF4865 family protein [Pseudonocardiaceae bacterium]|jgi:hypothetical protein|nr:DUF4865 family protein [Pseudonocardiaceae bacterium]